MRPPGRVSLLSIACILFIFAASCNHKKTIMPAYYFWRTGSEINTQEKALLMVKSWPGCAMNIKEFIFRCAVYIDYIRTFDKAF